MWLDHFGKVWQFYENVKFDSPYDPAILLPDKYPKEMKACVHTKLACLCFGIILNNTKTMETIQMPID